MARVAAIFEIPTPYRQPVLKRVQERTDLEVDFFFLSETQSDRLWEVERFPDLRATVLPGSRITFPGYHTIHLNRGVGVLLRPGFYDTFVLNGYAQPALVRILRHCWRERVPYVMLTESHLGKNRPWLVRALKDRFVRNVYGRSKANLVMGEASAEYVRFYGAPPGEIFLFPNAVDGPDFAARVDLVRTGASLAGGPVILFVGMLNRRKGVDLLLRSFRTLAGRFPRSRLRFVGTGRMEGDLRREAERSGVGGRVSFEGFVQPDELPRVYAEADLFVLPSQEEPFGAVVCEAMAASLPVVVSSAVGAARDFVREGRNGRMFPAGDGEALTDALAGLLADRALREKMGQEGRRTMGEWTHDRLADSFVAAVSAARRSLVVS